MPMIKKIYVIIFAAIDYLTSCKLWRCELLWTHYYSSLTTCYMVSCSKICDIFCGTNIFLDLFSLSYYIISHKCNKEKKNEGKKEKENISS